MSELISGKEAKLAWAEGYSVQVATGPDEFRTLNSGDYLGVFCSGNYFRLKPRTITINNIEVPAPFEPKEGESFWYIHSHAKCGYSRSSHLGVAYFGAWRTEEEIKQVVAALRSIFK